MSYAGVLALFMPLGIWLIQSAAAPRTQEMRVAATGLLVLITSTLLYIAIGFAFMFGSIGNLVHTAELSQYTSAYRLPVVDQTWGIIGLHGFFLSDATSTRVFQLMISYLPLALTSALLVSGLLSTHTRLLVHLVMTALTSAVLFPIVGYWIYGGGWLAALGVNLSLGHGAVDIGGLASAALVAGGAGLAWLIVTPRREAQPNPELPATQFPIRTVSGIVLLIAGTAAFVGGNPLYPPAAGNAVDVLALNSLLACSFAVILSLGYGAFASHKLDVLLAARSALAAVIAVSAGAVLLPAWTAIMAGLLVAILATLGYYYINEGVRLQDDAGIISLVIVPAFLGYLMTGLFASGAFTSGWNGVGPSSYLGVANLGVTGVFPGAAAVGDPGQLTAQVTVSAVVFAFAFIATLPVAYVMRGLAGYEAQPESRFVAKRIRTVRPQPLTDVASVGTITPASAYSTMPTSLPDPVKATDSIPVSRIESPAPLTQGESNNTASVRTESASPVAAKGPVTPSPQQSMTNLLEKLRSLRYRNKKPDAPVQARHVAYPTRAGGRRILIRPITKASNDTPPAAEGSKPAP